MGSQCRLLAGCSGFAANRRFRDGVGMPNRKWIDDGMGSRVYYGD